MRDLNVSRYAIGAARPLNSSDRVAGFMSSPLEIGPDGRHGALRRHLTGENKFGYTREVPRRECAERRIYQPVGRSGRAFVRVPRT